MESDTLENKAWAGIIIVKTKLDPIIMDLNESLNLKIASASKKPGIKIKTNTVMDVPRASIGFALSMRLAALLKRVKKIEIDAKVKRLIFLDLCSSTRQL